MNENVTLTENATGSGSAVRVTRNEYTDDGWLRKLKCDNSATGLQVTEWIYGVTVAGGSALDSKRLVREKLYPGAAAPVSYSYNRQLQPTAMTDQAGTAHAYGYDKLGRPVTDQIAAFGTGVGTARTAPMARSHGPSRPPCPWAPRGKTENISQKDLDKPNGRTNFPLSPSSLS